MRRINLKGAEYVCHVWGGAEGWYVIEKRGFTSYERAMMFASKESGLPTVREVSITSGTGQDLERLAVYRDGKQREAVV